MHVLAIDIGGTHVKILRGLCGDSRTEEGRRKKMAALGLVDVVKRLSAALEPDEVVLGGGNAKKFEKLPPDCRAGDNANACLGGFRLWANADGGRRPIKEGRPS